MSCEVSIIIPTLNRAVLLEKTLDSIIAQSFMNWECLIIDDGSDKDNLEYIKKVIKKDSKIYYYSRPSNIINGPSGCRNYGLNMAKGHFIQFFDDDDIMYPEMISVKMDLIVDTLSDVVVAPLDFYNVELSKIEKKNKVFSNSIITDYILGNISWYVSGPLWKKEFLKEEFDISIQTLDDWDFNLRNIYKNPKISFLKTSLQRYNRYRAGETLSTLGQMGNERQIESAFITYKKHYVLLKKQNFLTAKLHSYLFNKIIFLLRASLVNKQVVSKDIYKFLIKNLHMKEIMKFSKIIIGYYCYKFFNRGYSFFNLK